MKTNYTTRVVTWATALKVRYIRLFAFFGENKYTTRPDTWATYFKAKYTTRPDAWATVLTAKYTTRPDAWATVLTAKYTTRLAVWATVFCVGTFSACSIYSLSGSTLPPHIKTVEIPVFGNTTLEPGIDNDVTTELSSEIMKSQLRPANEGADATISGKVTRYSNRPHTFGAGGAEVSVEQYIVQISADVEFYDNVSARSIYKGTVSGEGAYDFQSESEQIGRDRAVKNLVEKIIQNSVQIW